MIEVLVAVLVVSFGMIGIAATLFATIHSATSNYSRQVAVEYAYDIIDRMRANDAEAAIAGGPYTATLSTPSSTPPTTCVDSSCTAAEMAAYDIWEWQTELENNLPSGLGSVTIAAGSSSTYTVTVTVEWIDSGTSAFSATSNSNGSSSSSTGSSLASHTLVTAL